MLVGVKNEDLYQEFYEYISDPQTRDAFQFFVKVAATSSKYDCEMGYKGVVKQLTFKNGRGEIPYAFIIAKKWLNFYFRNHAVRSGGSQLKQWLQSNFPTDFDGNPNSGNEWTLKIKSIQDIQLLQSRIDF